ncbi:hypothetical protein Cgig2_032111 [Carnegiea gigantea]|uniref:Dolichyl-diphosphooligosaccharide--protein glycosyltransferase subunit DAD1 n=1 Tax=Carnegiea gigantea TaxID=171969 RepID=A0A9Q1QBF5_9CARY|nr:hypothetical protein Cgig2_032111 [Carnegiea gigantea]
MDPHPFGCKIFVPRVTWSLVSEQVVYMAIVGSFPFNSFLSGVLSCVGTAVLGVCLRIQVNKENKEFKVWLLLQRLFSALMLYSGLTSRTGFCRFCSLQSSASFGYNEFLGINWRSPGIIEVVSLASVGRLTPSVVACSRPLDGQIGHKARGWKAREEAVGFLKPRVGKVETDWSLRWWTDSSGMLKRIRRIGRKAQMPGLDRQACEGGSGDNSID